MSAPQDTPGIQVNRGDGQTRGNSHPSSTSGTDADADQGRAPKEVTRAFHLILAAGVLYLIAAIISALITPISDLPGAAPFERGISLFLSASITAAYVVLALFIRRGKGWARITATILAGLNVLLNLGSLALLPFLLEFSGGRPIEGVNGLSITVGLIVMLLGVAGVVMTYLKPARPYFAPRRLGY